MNKKKSTEKAEPEKKDERIPKAPTPDHLRVEPRHGYTLLSGISGYDDSWMRRR